MVKSYLKVGIVLAALLILFEKWVGEQRYVASCAKKTPQTQLQPITHLLNEQGKLAGQGWSINSPKIINNQELAISHYDSVGVSALMKRNCNFFLIKAHNAQITMAVPMQLGGICISKLSWFDVELGPATEKVIESWVCPEMSPEDTYTFASNGIRLIDGDLSIVIQPDSQVVGGWTVDIIANKIGLELHASLVQHEGMTWITPLDDANQKYFYTLKTLALPLTGTLRLNDVTEHCTKDTCLMNQDSFRAHMNYPVNYFFLFIQTITDDKRTLGIAMGDGIGSATSNKQSSEDFLSLDGKVHKLDISKLVDDPNDIWSVKNIKSIERGLFNSSCDLFYEPKYQQDNVIYVVFIAFKQRVTWGRFSGHCMVEGERIEVDSWGFFEHMHMRW